MTDFKDFWVAVGQPGAYSANMQYDTIYGLNRDFGIKIKHIQFAVLPKIKNVVKQSWPDEDGDDVWLPKTSSGAPTIVHEAVEFNATFVIFNKGGEVKDSVYERGVYQYAQHAIRELLGKIEGRWLKIWDEYTQTGYEGVYLADSDKEPKFKRRNYDYAEFTLKFRANGANIDAPFEGIV